MSDPADLSAVIERMVEIAEGYDVAALCEDAIHERFRPEMDIFVQSRIDNPGPPINLRHIREGQTAKNNAERFRKEAADIRVLIEIARQSQIKD